MILFVIQILKLYHTHFYYANKGVCFFMRAANGMGTVFKLSDKRRKPWAYLGPKYYSIEEKRYKRDELHPKSWTQDWRCSFFMSKLTREDKIEIYERRKKGETISSLVKAFNICESNIKYLITLIEKYGNNILRKDKNRVYSKEFKLQAINRILINHESINSVALDIGLVSAGILHNWLSKFKENGYNVVEKKKGRKTKSMTKPKKNDKELSEKEKIKKLEEENLYLKAENEYLKKLRALVQERELKEKKK